VDESFRVNRASWDERAPAHAASPGYAVDRWRLPHSYTLRAVKPAA